jgi:site-specific DNA recombinase
MRVVGYTRCSSAEQAAEGLSLETQRRIIATWCEMASAHLVEFVDDAGISGSRMLADRPGGQRIAALLDAQRPNVDAVVIVRLDRLGRDAAETLAYLSRFTSGGVGLVSITDRVELSSPQGRAMAQVSAAFAELERALIGQRTSEALRVLRGQGRPYGPIPFGFSVVDDQLVPNETEQRVISQILRQRKRGHSYQRVADTLNSAGVPAKRGGKWHAMTVRSVMRTHALIGTGHERHAA